MALTISRRDRWPSCPIRALSQPNGAPVHRPSGRSEQKPLARHNKPTSGLIGSFGSFNPYIDVRLVRRSRHPFLSDRLERRLRLVRTLFP
jgi:hypothetical protein